MSEPPPATMTEERLKLFRDCFTGRQEVYGTYDPQTGRVRQVKQPVTDQVLLDHLEGHRPYGVYLLVNNQTRAVVTDFDNEDPTAPLAFIRRAVHHGVRSYLERSKRKGWHVWVFTEWPSVSAAKARSVVRLILAEIGVSSTELFPKQDRLAGQGSYGNFINAPLYGGLVGQGRTVFVDTSRDMKPFPDQWAVLESVRRVTERELDDIMQAHGLTPPSEGPFPYRSSSEDVAAARTFGLPPCAQRMLAEGVTEHQRVACFRLALHLRKAGLPRDFAVAALEIWASHNRPQHNRRIITKPEIIEQTAFAFRRPYRSCGCEDPAVEPYCDGDCPLKRSARATGVPGDTFVPLHERSVKMSSQQPQKPVREFRAGGGGVVTAAVWRNEHDREGRLVVSYSIRLQKRYYDRDTRAWQDSDCFFPEDLPKIRLVIDKAYEYTVLRERDLNPATSPAAIAQAEAEAGVPAEAE